MGSRKKLVGEKPDTLETIYLSLERYRSEKRYDMIFRLSDELLEEGRLNFSIENTGYYEYVILIFHNLADCYIEKEQHGKAGMLLGLLFKMQKGKYGMNHHEAIYTLMRAKA